MRTSRHPTSFSRRSSCRQFHDGYFPTIRRPEQTCRGTREELGGQSQAVPPSGLWRLPEIGELLRRDLCRVRGNRVAIWISQSRRRLHPDALESSRVERASRSTIDCSFRAINFQKRLFRRDAESPSRTGISTRDARATRTPRTLACDRAFAEAKRERRV